MQVLNYFTFWGGNTWLCSRFISGSVCSGVIQVGVGYLKGCWGLNPVQSCVRQAPWPLCYLLSPDKDIIFKEHKIYIFKYFSCHIYEDQVLPLLRSLRDKMKNRERTYWTTNRRWQNHILENCLSCLIMQSSRKKTGRCIFRKGMLDAHMDNTFPVGWFSEPCFHYF